MLAVGKRIVDDLYIHLSALAHVADPEIRQRIEEAIPRVPLAQDAMPNVAKLNLRTGRLSLLAYPNFEDEPFPTLAASWAFASGPLAIPTYRNYRESLNPPVLHRKELLVAKDHPQRDCWRLLTTAAEGLGLFDNTTTIGFRLNWERLIVLTLTEN